MERRAVSRWRYFLYAGNAALNSSRLGSYGAVPHTLKLPVCGFAFLRIVSFLLLSDNQDKAFTKTLASLTCMIFHPQERLPISGYFWPPKGGTMSLSLYSLYRQVFLLFCTPPLSWLPAKNLPQREADILYFVVN